MSKGKDWWYAVLKDEDDKDYSIGSHDEDEAEEISKRPEYDYDTVLIAEVLFIGKRKLPFVYDVHRPFCILSHIVC